MKPSDGEPARPPGASAQVMDDFEALVCSGTVLERCLPALVPARYEEPSVCAGWSAAELANHVVGGETRYLLLLRGAATAVAEATRGQDHIGDDPAAAYARVSRVLDEEFHRPGALERTARHHTGERSGLDLLRMRVMERAMHAWDLARTLGLDASLDPGLVDYLLGNCLPLVAEMRDKGLYGMPAGGTGLAEPPLPRLLRLTGRDPGTPSPSTPGNTPGGHSL